MEVVRRSVCVDSYETDNASVRTFDWSRVAALLVATLNPRLPGGSRLEADGQLLRFYDGQTWSVFQEVVGGWETDAEEWRLTHAIDVALTHLQDFIPEQVGTWGTAWPTDPDADGPLPGPWVEAKDGVLRFGYGSLCFYGPESTDDLIATTV
jgi:hypothetical protein